MSDLLAPTDPRALIDIPVRPEADVFPMLEGDAFLDLAAGIRLHGQIEPVELDADGAIGDGRNRYAACRWLGIEPRTVTLPADTDWLARVIERNLNRRHATVGARAVALVRAGASLGSSDRAIGRRAGLSDTTILRARFLVEHADAALIGQVEQGASLRMAYDVAVQRERERVAAEHESVDDDVLRVQRLAELDAERARLLAAIRSERDRVGEAVVLPPEPELAVRMATPAEVEQVAVPQTDLDVQALRAQERLHVQLRRAKDDLTAIAAVAVDPDGPMFEGLVMAMRSWATQVVATSYEIVGRYNAALEGKARVRRVK